MQSTASLLLSLACALGYIFACARTRPPIEIERGPDAEISADGLYRVRGTSLQYFGVKSDADLQRYESFVIEPVSVAYKQPPNTNPLSRRRQSNFALNDDEMERMKRLFHEIFEAGIGADGRFRVVSERGPGALRLSARIVDLVVKTPSQDSAPGRTHSWVTSSGEMTLLLELRDSLSDESLARVADRQVARRGEQLYYSSVTSGRGDVTRIFKGWVRALMDDLKGGWGE